MDGEKYSKTYSEKEAVLEEHLMNDDFLSIIYLLLVLVLILPGFIYANKNRKIFFNNFLIWVVIIGVIVIFLKFL